MYGRKTSAVEVVVVIIILIILVAWVGTRMKGASFQVTGPEAFIKATNAENKIIELGGEYDTVKNLKVEGTIGKSGGDSYTVLTFEDSAGNKFLMVRGEGYPAAFAAPLQVIQIK